MHTGVIRAFKLSILKMYSVVYLVLALPMAYYSINYISLVKDHMSVTLPLFALVMAMSVAGACFVQSRTLKRISLFLKGDNQILIADFETSLMKKDAYALPARLSAVMLFGWVVLLNLFVFIPSFMFLEASAADFIVCNMLSLSSGLMSLPITWLVAERAAASFLELPQIMALPEPKKTLRIPLTTKLLIVCLIIIGTLILNNMGALFLSVICGLTLQETIANTGLISGLGVVNTIIISLLFSRSVKMPVLQLRTGAESLKKGRLSTVIPRYANDELGDSSSAFNSVVEKLSRIVRDIKSSVESTKTLVASLSSAMKESDESADEINRYSVGVRESVAKQSAIIREVTATIHQISSTVEQQDDKIADQSRSVGESSSAIEELIANIQSIALSLERSSNEFDKLQSVIKTGHETVGDLKTHVTVLSTQSDSVFEANSIIQNIAAQTNLLAMNAAIEAAHAGDKGRGFAVVADEIRKLAEVSNQQSRVISESLQVLKKTIDQAVSIAGKTGSSFDSIISSVKTVTILESEIKHAIEEQSSGSTQILRALTAMNDITRDVQSGSAEMLAGNSRILSGVSGLLDMTEQVNSAASGVVDKARTVKNHTEESMKLLSRNAENMKTIDDQVGFFDV